MVYISSIVPLPLAITKKVPNLITFTGFADGKEHFALDFREPSSDIHFVRIHSECITGDLFHSERCDCGAQLNEALQIMDKASGVIIYLRQEGRGIGLIQKMKAYQLQIEGLDTFEANRQLGEPNDARDFGIAADMLGALGVNKIRLVSNNPEKKKAIEDSGIQIVDLVTTRVYETAHNKSYLKAKRNHGHLLTK
ncbi:GTP cyclohydrolase II RibA [Rhizobium sp. FKY42]|uniref:GTP cyclohydrolase II RibA n=1 Tax=Rhizobium sp. FKY42 TaxID=2562310 RepID=UPI0010C1308F|nr:GTP cyclohydrolase II RibA [Rhizobium sp. FKY42]